MSRLCSIHHDIPVTMHTPAAYGQWSVFDHNGDNQLAVLGTRYGIWWPWYGQFKVGWLQPLQLWKTVHTWHHMSYILSFPGNRSGHPLNDYHTPHFNEVESGVYWFHLVHLSVGGHNGVHTVSSTILGRFHFIFFISYQATSEGVSRVMFVSKFKNFGKFFKFVTLTLFSFDLGSDWGANLCKKQTRL